METVLILLLLLFPLVGFITNMCVGKKLGKTLPGIISTTVVALSFFISLYFFVQLLSEGTPIKVHLFEWISLQDLTINFDLVLDQLSLLWLLFVTGIGTLIHIYSIGYMHGDENVDRFFAYLNLFIFFMILLVTANNLLVMFIGWEGVGLCSYLLIGFWYKNQSYNDAAKKAFIMNRIGDLGFLIGLITIAYLFKTIEFDALKNITSQILTTETIALLGVATFCLFIGATGKSAQIPLYTWLPDAMAGPTPVSALIHAATMVTAGIFMITRLNFIFDLTPHVQSLIAIIGALTALFAASIGLVQNDIKKVLAYSTVSQLGLMFVAIGFGAYHIAVFHVITHAFFKACLFLGSGSVIHAMGGEQDMRKMGGLKGVMTITYITFFVSTLSISGIPPFAGFFSKDEIMLVAFQNNPFVWLIAALASLMTAFYMFRVLYLTFFKSFRGTDEQKKHLHESPISMTFPLIVLAILATIGGLIGLPFGYNWLNNFLTPVLPQLAEHATHHSESSEQYILMIVSTIIAILGMGFAYYKYMVKSEVPSDDKQIEGFAKVLYNKYYIDELYNMVCVKPVYAISTFFNNTIERIISNFVLLFGMISAQLSIQSKKLHNGNLGFYLFVFTVSFCSLIIYLFLVK